MEQAACKCANCGGIVVVVLHLLKEWWSADNKSVIMLRRTRTISQIRWMTDVGNMQKNNNNTMSNMVS
jgi:hypothetical protein